MLKAGAVHTANGGYLLLSARDVLTNPGVWPTMKRVIRTKEVRIEDPFEQLDLSLRRAPAPAHARRGQDSPHRRRHALPAPRHVRRGLLGDFQGQGRFRLPSRAYQGEHGCLRRFHRRLLRENRTRHFDRSACAGVLEYASRVVADQRKMSSRFSWIKELVEEAEHWAEKDNVPLVSAAHVEKAIEERRYRHNLPDERIKEMIDRGIIMIDAAGTAVGQVNGLSIYSLGDVMFGKPSRITCQTFLGRVA